MPTNPTTALFENATAFLQKRHPGTIVLNGEAQLRGEASDELIKRVGLKIVVDHIAGVKVRALVLSDLNDSDDAALLAASVPSLFHQLDSGLKITAGGEHVEPMHSDQMGFSPRVLIYTDALRGDPAKWYEAFRRQSYVLEMVRENELFRTAFISYGGPDASVVAQVNKRLRSKGVRTWFFPVDAVPGQRLHRVMHDAVNKHDKVILFCSKASLSRPGLLNELEQVLDREAREGGSEILVPVALDDHVFSEWAPSRTDIARQVRSRVITQISTVVNGAEFHDQVERLITALKMQ